LGSLNQTVSHCLEFVSLDYFDGNQLRYSKENKMLYLIKEDLKDEDESIEEN